MPHRLILGIDTSTHNCSVGLVNDGEVIGVKSILGKSVASENLIDLIDKLFSKDIKFSNLDAIAISIGPGSYTGLRIGLSTVKGLAMPRNLPVLPVPTFSVLERVAQTEWSEDLLLFIKSRKDIVYFTASIKDERFNLSPQIYYDHFDIALAKYPKISVIVGNCKFPVDNSRTLYIRYPRGDYVALTAWYHYEDLLPMSKPELEPEYFTSLELEKWNSKDRMKYS
ncbi:MAG: tRNA (adenosine(37)-N6)-threonylcarbamoyltransferase complex dimerization subunit type 1 TsaB [Candidatus Marinimicrobia bacterium]|nr:tRNA (adenosine(37)-N6)-threonylcarbamoyltransferase complex dimerization subunit type 1 TsaB [Candidatus Neomarinimicrobiota bacterium]